MRMRFVEGQAARFVVLGCVLAAFAAPGFSQWNMELAVFGWKSDLDARARVTEAGHGTDIDFKRDLGFRDKNTPEYRLTFFRTIDFNGELYPVGTRVISSLDMTYGRLGWIWQFAQAGEGAFKLGTVLDIKHFAFDAALRAPNLVPPVDEKEDYSATLPTIGLAVDVLDDGPVSFYLEAAGVAAGDRGKVWDGEAGLKVTPIPALRIVATYRILHLEVRDDPDHANIEFRGPHIGLAFRF
jgi:hypothetical protein